MGAENCIFHSRCRKVQTHTHLTQERFHLTAQTHTHLTQRKVSFDCSNAHTFNIRKVSFDCLTLQISLLIEAISAEHSNLAAKVILYSHFKTQAFKTINLSKKKINRKVLPVESALSAIVKCEYSRRVA